MLTPETLTRHELVGLPVRVADAANPDLVGSSGRIVSETMRTFIVSEATESPLEGGDSEARSASDHASGRSPRAKAAGGSRDRQVPKRGTTFEFRLDSTEEITDSVGGNAPTKTTYEAASDRKATGDALKREQETAGVRPGQSCSTGTGSHSTVQATEGDCEGAVYVTVDGTKLLSRPALRTETAGDTIWQSD